MTIKRQKETIDGINVLTLLVFRRLDAESALALGLLASQRNMGLILAATDGVLPGLTWLYFALTQFSIYLTPLMLKPFVRTLQRRAAGADGE